MPLNRALLPLFSLLLFLTLGLIQAEDTVILTNGTKLTGKILQETEAEVILKRGDKLDRIPRNQVLHVKRSPNVGQQAPGNKPAGVRPDDKALIEARKRQEAEAKNRTLRLNQVLFDLGSADLDKYDAAMKEARTLGVQAHPTLSVMIVGLKSPTQNIQPMSDPHRLGAIKALAAIGQNSQYSYNALLNAVMRDRKKEIQQEAALALKTLNDENALKYLVYYAVQDKNQSLQYRACLALRSINNNKAFETIILNIRDPEVSSGGVGNVQVTTAQGIDRGPTRAMKWISGKDLGDSRAAWVRWLFQKTGRTAANNDGKALKKIP